MKAKCPVCRSPLSFGKEAFGKTGRCKSCGSVLAIDDDGSVSVRSPRREERKPESALAASEQADPSRLSPKARPPAMLIAALCLGALGLVVALVALVRGPAQEGTMAQDSANAIQEALAEIQRLRNDLASLQARSEPNSMRLRRLEVVDDAGKPIMEIGMLSGSETAERGFRIFDADGNERAVLGVNQTGYLLAMHDANRGAGITLFGIAGLDAGVILRSGRRGIALSALPVCSSITLYDWMPAPGIQPPLPRAAGGPADESFTPSVFIHSSIGSKFGPSLSMQSPNSKWALSLDLYMGSPSLAYKFGTANRLVLKSDDTGSLFAFADEKGISTAALTDMAGGSALLLGNAKAGPSAFLRVSEDDGRASMMLRNASGATETIRPR